MLTDLTLWHCAVGFHLLQTEEDVLALLREAAVMLGQEVLDPVDVESLMWESSKDFS